MIKPVTQFFDRIVQRYLPDAYLFAVILTLIVFALGLLLTKSTPIEMVQFWGNGFWDLLAFAMQMSLIVVTGYVLANTPAVKSILIGIARLAKTPGQAVMLVTFVAAVAWGDAWTNMIQPFWTLPLLAIAGLKIRDIIGFCVMTLLWGFIPITIGLLFL